MPLPEACLLWKCFASRQRSKHAVTVSPDLCMRDGCIVAVSNAVQCNAMQVRYLLRKGDAAAKIDAKDGPEFLSSSINELIGKIPTYPPSRWRSVVRADLHLYDLSVHDPEHAASGRAKP